MSLVLIALAAVVLAGVARYSLLIAVEAHDASESLQERWGTASLSRAVLGRAEKILAQRVSADAVRTDDRTQRLPAAYTVRLGNLDFQLLLDEENRKLNVNRLHTAGSRVQVLKVFRLLDQDPSMVWLRPSLADRRKPSTQAFDSWGQVYRWEELPSGEHPARWLMANARQLTCWGDGRVHYRDSEDQVLEVASQQAVGPVTAARLVDLRRRNPSLKLDELLDRLALRQAEKGRLRDWLTDQSTCFSLWITVKGPDRPRYALMVTEPTTDGSLHIRRFTW